MNTKVPRSTIKTNEINISIKELNFVDIKETDVNAQEMDKNDFLRLTKNIKKDGKLTSTPLVMKKGNGYICVSGHHRIRAAIKAKILKGYCMVMDEVDDSTRYRLQLSHNDINGTSNEEKISIIQKMISGIDLELIKSTSIAAEKVKDLETINYNPPVFKHISIALLEESREALTDMIIALGDSDDPKYILEKNQYEDMKDLLTLAFEKGFRSPGQAFGKFMDIINNHKDEIERD